jgi:hypothetical protein
LTDIQQLSKLKPAQLLATVRRGGRYGQRDAVLILLEIGRAATLDVRRAKNGTPSAHTLPGDEIRTLRELRRQPSSLRPNAAVRSRPTQ